MKRLIIEDVEVGDVLSDVLQATQCVLVDRRGPNLMEQIQMRGVTRTEAARWLRDCADDLERGPHPQ